MKTSLFAAFTLVVALTTGSFAKSETTKIVIEGGNLTRPVEIVDPALLKSFNVWGGRGVVINGAEQTGGFIIDWSAGIFDRPPAHGHRYEVSFFIGTADPVYVVSYVSDASTQEDFVYIPRTALNTRAISRDGLEDNWFRASTAWEQAVRPLLARAAR